ncbi:hypothetical protein DFH09DRAFT_1362308 [Mycena vulgaris]|nr:hypothetical protein DFH09DRAFT_1362308 [Mycena vulgaris]
MSARDSVVQTPELVEHTLALPPICDLLVTAPLVNKMWQAITLSPTLQRALFFEADSTASASHPVKNPLLAQAPEAFKRADASWRRMLVTQPPAQTMFVIQTSHGRGGMSECRAVLRDHPLRMGMLYDFGCVVVWEAPKRVVDERFDRDGKNKVEINYGEWVDFGWGRQQEEEEEEEEGEGNTWD